MDPNTLAEEETVKKTAPDRSLTSAEVAERTEGTLHGDDTIEVAGAAALRTAGADQLGFLASRSYLGEAEDTEARALLVHEDLVGADGLERFPALIAVADPHAALRRLLEYWFPEEAPEPGIHPTAVIGRGVQLGEAVYLGPYTVLEAGVRVGDRTRLDGQVTVGRDAVVGSDCHLHPQVVVYPEVEIGDRVILHAGARIGVDGFGYVQEDGRARKIPQVGTVVVEDDVEIGAGSCVDRGSIGDTVIGRGCKLDNLVHVAHNVEVGEGTMMAAQVGIAGSVRIGRGVLFGGQSGAAGHQVIGDGAQFAAQAGAIGDVDPGQAVAGFPARDLKPYMKAMAAFPRLPDLLKRVRRIERALEEADEG